MIRRACDKDIDRVNALLQQVLTVHAEGRPDIFKAGTTKYTDGELKEIFRNDETPVFVYTDENDVTVGYCFCIFEEIRNSNNMYDMKSIYIDDLCVD